MILRAWKTQLMVELTPAQLAVSVGFGRVGIAGWIVDNALGKDADFDEATAKLLIAELCEQKLIGVNEFQKLEMTDQGNQKKSRVK